MGAKLGERLERKYSPAAAELRHLALPGWPALRPSSEPTSHAVSRLFTISYIAFSWLVYRRLAVFDVRVAF
jgi:hypothetical protein